jgi:hypothetical protein
MSIRTRWLLARVTSSGRCKPDILKIAIPDTDNVFTILLEGLLANVSEYRLGGQPVMTWLTTVNERRSVCGIQYVPKAPFSSFKRWSAILKKNAGSDVQP